MTKEHVTVSVLCCDAVVVVRRGQALVGSMLQQML